MLSLVLRSPPAAAAIGLFARLSDDALARTGLPAVLAPANRAVATEDDRDKLQPYLPQEAFEALFLIACGYELDRAIRENSRPPVEAAPRVDTEDFAAALQRPASQRQFAFGPPSGSADPRALSETAGSRPRRALERNFAFAATRR